MINPLLEGIALFFDALAIFVLLRAALIASIQVLVFNQTDLGRLQVAEGTLRCLSLFLVATFARVVHMGSWEQVSVLFTNLSLRVLMPTLFASNQRKWAF